MLTNLSVLILLFQVSRGFYLDTNLDSWQTDLTNNVEHFLEGPDNNISMLCKQDLTQYIQALRTGKQWAAQMFDAGAKLVHQGVLAGNLVDLGSFDECLNIEHHINGSKIHGKYCLGKISVDVTLQEIERLSETTPETVELPVPNAKILPTNEKFDVQMAKCFPNSCSGADMQEVYAHYGFQMVFDDGLCQTKADQPKLDKGGVVTISIFGVILGMVVASTAYDVTLYYLKRKPRHSLLVAFSALTNGKSLIATSEGSNDISCIHGIRAISIMWSICFHEYVVGLLFPTKNYFYEFEWFSNEANMYMFSSSLSIDTFFFLTGLLISYRFMGDMAKRAKFNIFIHYINRYLRLTPSLLFVVVFYLSLLKLIGSGPLWPSEIQNQLVKGCEMYWGRTLFYIQNMYSSQDRYCVGPSWYLTVDIQLFLLSPIVLIPLGRHARIAVTLLASLTVLSTMASFFCGWMLELNSFLFLMDGGTKLAHFITYYYFPAYTRASPWLIGIMVGFLIFKTKQEEVRLESRVAMAALWGISMAVLCICVFVGHQTAFVEYNRLINSFHFALVRPAWVLAMTWVIFSCVSGHGGPVNGFLSLPVFQVVSKLTYCIYLLHSPVMYVIRARMRTVPVFDNSEVAYTFWADFAITLALSVVLHLAVECPVIKINKYLFGGTAKKQT